MRIVAFLYVDCGKPEYVPMAEGMVASVRKAMPDAHIVQMTSPTTASIEGINQRVDRPVDAGNAPLMVYRTEHLANFPYDQMLLLDTDVVMQKDPWGVFDTPFDMAFTTRDRDVKLNGTSINIAMPYNIGVMFSRCARFWREAHQYVLALPRSHKEWWGDQLAVKAITDSARFKVHEVPGSMYNYSPDSENDTEGRYMLHYKGPRKVWLLNRKAA